MDVTTRVGDVHTLFIDIVDSLSRFDFDGSGKEKIMAWVARLNSRGAPEQLSDEDKEQVTDAATCLCCCFGPSSDRLFLCCSDGFRLAADV